MKSYVSSNDQSPIIVAPLVGAWIEIIGTEKMPIEYIVAPLVGAWIEIRETLKERN